MEKHGQGTHCTKMGADSSAENTPNALELSAQFVCPSPKVLDFNEKRLHWASVLVVREFNHIPPCTRDPSVAIGRRHKRKDSSET